MANPVAEEIRSYLGTDEITDEDITHYGVKRRSGRYPWGSGENPYQHSGDLLSRVNELKKQGLSEKEIALAIGTSTGDLRMQLRVANHQRKQLEYDRIKSLQEDGHNNSEIARIMGFKNESSVRSRLNENTVSNRNRAQETANALKKEMEKKGMLDVGRSAELELGVSKGTLKEALFILQTEGYEVYGIGVPQATNMKQQTNLTVLAKPGTEYKDVYAARDRNEINSIGDYHSTDGGSSFQKLKYPASISSSRVGIRYGDQGGADKDGVIELRRGVADLDLGNSHYAQVRILVDGTHYLKGMAMYSDDIPDGVDIMFNTNKTTGTPKEKVMKAIKDDPENPFGATIKANGQSKYIGKDGKEHLSAINKLKEEGDWDKQSLNLSSQFLSKQPRKLIKQQLDATYADWNARYKEILSLENPTLRKELLRDFANECESAVVHMKAAALPRQTSQVILPMTMMKDNEVYAPNYRDGEKIALVRFPHGGTFEIPILTVNNRNKEAREILPLDVTDAIGINPKVAARLSGADFDGDSVTAIPISDKANIKSTKPLDGLIDFDPKTAYAIPEGNPAGVKIMSESYKQKQMGLVSNLITDMTLRGANESELARAVRHSMVVIDAPKHKLDYQKSERDNGIRELMEQYQGYTDSTGKRRGGASTLISRHKQDVEVPERKGQAKIDKETGEVTYSTSGRTYVDKKTGQVKQATTKAKLLIETKDLHTISSGSIAENLYADYGNKLKALTNEARKAYVNEKPAPQSKTAKEKYSAEVASLNEKLKEAARNEPRERRAQLISWSQMKAKEQDNPALKNDKEALRKARNRSINDARAEIGASSKQVRIKVTDREWEAIQAGAISSTVFKQIYRYADKDELKERALPKQAKELSPSRVSKLKSMAASGNYTNSEIAIALGCSPSTVVKYIKS